MIQPQALQGPPDDESAVGMADKVHLLEGPDEGDEGQLHVEDLGSVRARDVHVDSSAQNVQGRGGAAIWKESHRTSGGIATLELQDAADVFFVIFFATHARNPHCDGVPPVSKLLHYIHEPGILRVPPQHTVGRPSKCCTTECCENPSRSTLCEPPTPPMPLLVHLPAAPLSSFRWHVMIIRYNTLVTPYRKANPRKDMTEPAPPSTTLDAIFDSANKALINNDFGAAAEGYEVLRRHGHHPAVNHNLALAQALDGHGDVAMELLLSNKEKSPTYITSYVLAAELHRRAARGSTEGAGLQLLEDAADLVKTPLEADAGNIQACIVASETLATNDKHLHEAVKWHIMALAAMRIRHSKHVTNFTLAFMDNLLASSVHHFGSPPETGTITGTVSLETRTTGRCIAIVRRAGQPQPASPLGPEWPVLHVTFGPGPTRTEPGQAHVRTTFPWAAWMATAALVADVGQSVVFDPCAATWKPAITETQALITISAAAPPGALCCLKPSSPVEVKILCELFRPSNVPPSKPSEKMATTTFHYLVHDSQLDVEEVT